MANIYNPSKVSVIIKETDSGASRTLVGFAEGEMITVEDYNEAKHKLGRGVFPGVISVGVNESLLARITITMESTHADNAYLSDLVNNSTQFSLSISGNYGATQDRLTMETAVVESIYKMKIATDIENAHKEWMIIGGPISTGMYE